MNRSYLSILTVLALGTFAGVASAQSLTGFEDSPQAMIPATPVPMQAAPVPAQQIMAAPQAIEGGFTLAKALEYTYLNNPEIKARRSAFRAVQEELPQAQAGWKPIAAAEAGVTRTDVEGSSFGGDGTVNTKDMGVSVNQPLYRGGRTVAQTGAAKYTIEAQQAMLSAAEQQVLLRAVTAYMDILRDEAVLTLTENNYNLLMKQMKATQDRFEYGEVTRTDVSQSEARLAEAESDIIGARGALKSSKAAFLEIIGQEPTGLVKPTMNLTAPNSLEEAQAMGEGASPYIVAAVNTHKASEKDVDNVFGELLPDIGLFGSWDKAYDPSPGLTDEQTTSAIGIAARIPLYEAGATRSRIRQAKNVTNQRFMEISQTRRDVQQYVTENWERLQTTRSQIISRRAQVEAAIVAEEGVRREADLGARTIIDTLDAFQELLDAQVALAITERDEVVAQFSLLESMGMLTPQTLGFGDKAVTHDENLKSIQRKIFDTDVDRVE